MATSSRPGGSPPRRGSHRGSARPRRALRPGPAHRSCNTRRVAPSSPHRDRSGLATCRLPRVPWSPPKSAAGGCRRSARRPPSTPRCTRCMPPCPARARRVSASGSAPRLQKSSACIAYRVSILVMGGHHARLNNDARAGLISTAQPVILEVDGIREAALARLGEGLGARAYTELAEQRFDVEFDRVERDAQATRNHLVGQPLVDYGQDLHFSRRQERLQGVFLQRSEPGSYLGGVREHDVGLIHGIDRLVASLAHQLAQRLPARGIRGVDEDAQAEGGHPVGGGAHSAGRASIIASSDRTVPPRTTRNTALRPMLPGASWPASRRNPTAGASFTLSTMSPAMIPALAAGPPSARDITISPLGWPACSRSASGRATGCSATPSQPRATWPSLRSTGTMRSTV